MPLHFVNLLYRIEYIYIYLIITAAGARQQLVSQLSSQTWLKSVCQSDKYMKYFRF